MKKLLVTGAAGFIGSHLVDSGLARGYEVTALVKPGSSRRNLPERDHLTVKECDVRDAKSLASIIEEFRPDLLFHFAAQPFVMPSWVDPVLTIETNVIGTLNVFEPIKRLGLETRVVVACSSAGYGSTTSELSRPLRESDPMLAINPYGVSKVATELLARQYALNFGVDAVNLRIFPQTGVRKVGDACSDFVRAVARIELGLQEPVIEVGNLSTYRDITGIKDTVQGVWLTATKGLAGETYCLCSGRKLLIRDLLEKIIFFSSKSIEVVENAPAKVRAADEDVIVGDFSKLASLGFKPIQPVDEFLSDMYDYWLDFYKFSSE